MIVERARACVGTRFHHQGRLPGAGLDCVGLLVVAMRSAGVQFTDCTDYGRRHDNGRLVRELESRLDRVAIADMQPGDVVSFTWTGRDAHTQHVAIVTGTAPLTIVHANSSANVRAVVEHTADAYWQSRISGVFRAREEQFEGVCA